MSKYYNQKITVDGITFDSKKEYRRYRELCLMERAGEIDNLERQVKFELIPTQKKNGKVVERACSYVADFVYNENGEQVVEDTKGIRTEAYKIKRKMMRWLYDIEIKEV